MTISHQLKEYRNKDNFHFSLWFFRSLLSFSTLVVFTLNYSTMKDVYNFGQNPFKLFFIKFDIFSLLGFNLGYTISILFLLLVIIGFLPALTSTIHFYIQSSYILHYPNMSDGGDYIVTIILFLLIISSISDFRIFSWKIYKKNTFNTLYQREANLINYQAVRLFISIVYFHAVVSKFHVVEWYNGTALYYFINDPLSGNANLIDIPLFKNALASPVFITIISWGALLTETLISFMLFCTDPIIRKRIFILGCLLHIAIAPLFFIPMFSFRMICCLYYYLLVNPKKVNL